MATLFSATEQQYVQVMPLMHLIKIFIGLSITIRDTTPTGCGLFCWAGLISIERDGCWQRKRL